MWESCNLRFYFGFLLWNYLKTFKLLCDVFTCGIKVWLWNYVIIIVCFLLKILIMKFRGFNLWGFYVWYVWKRIYKYLCGLYKKWTNKYTQRKELQKYSTSRIVYIDIYGYFDVNSLEKKDTSTYLLMTTFTLWLCLLIHENALERW